ncbi:MAG: LON peptidase substrate-binding domain-containing protein [Chloroflexota bacterium]
MRSLPLFPLNVVLFPGRPLQLRVFEPRYRRMLEDCARGDNRFGVVLISEGVEVGGEAVPHEVGTVARIAESGDRLGEVIPLTVVGERRFRILGLDRSLPYLSGEVEELPEPANDGLGEETWSAAREAAARFVRAFLMYERGEWLASPSLPDDPMELGYQMGALVSSVRPYDAQAALEADTVSGLLESVIAPLGLASRHLEALAADRGSFSSN